MKQQSRADKLKLLNDLATGKKTLHDLVDTSGKPWLVLRESRNHSDVFSDRDGKEYMQSDIDKAKRSKRYTGVIKVVYEAKANHNAA